MLELRNIIKDYVSGNNTTHALKGISVNFRKNEFVSILGASGCGKTTTLNIIGGLDRYTSGDLLINGKSTKDYTDRDWDTYRNHSIGFIFQTYNLIAHQNILKNVELALTISGVSKEERKNRALNALKQVGLEGMEKKKPNQLSGGQCQRVAIARALINNPEILLADEPTGALDSETSIQIMDLLKQVASDRLVIMVTHNPDLAYKYSTRIVKMSDGLLTEDSNPFEGKDEIVEQEVVNKGKKKKSSMSLPTSMGLSLSNLGSKLRRTILVTIAGSIGIIGVSAVLAVSRGVKDFIGDMQEDMLSAYPIEIAEESVDYTSLMSGLNADTSKEALEFDVTKEVGVDSMINFLMTAYSDITSVKTNTIDDKLLDYINNIEPSYYSAIFNNYAIDPTNNIFTEWTHNFDNADVPHGEGSKDFVSLNGLTQSYIAELKTVSGFKSYASYVNLFTGFMNELPAGEDYLLDQYDLIAGSKFATEENEMMLVVDSNTTLTDLLLAEMGVYEHDDFLKIAKKAIKEQEIAEDDPDKKQKMEDLKNKYKYAKTFKFEDLLNRKFYYYPQSTIYNVDETKSEYQVAKVRNTASITLELVDSITHEMELYMLTYDDTDTLNGNFISMKNGGMAFEQVTFTRADELVPDFSTLEAYAANVLSGTWTRRDSGIGKDITLTFSVDTENPSIQSATITADDEADKTSIFCMVYPESEDVRGANYNGFIDNIDMINNPENYKGQEMKITGILRLKDDRSFGSLERGLYYSKAFATKYMKDASLNDECATLTRTFRKHIDNYKSEPNQEGFEAYVKFKYIDHTDDVESDDPELNKVHGEVKESYASALNGDMSSSFADLFSAITGVNYLETDSVHFRSVCGLKINTEKDPDTSNIINITYEKLPKSISIYPKNFESKNKITDYLDKWNDDSVNITLFKGTENEYTYSPKERDALTYTDTIELIIGIINTFINAITVSLVVFTSLSLVVSCFMIAVITYISVVERIKEIGVIRSLGGRKGDVASLFVMETLLTGAFSGVFGVSITYILCLILNIILKAKFGIVIAHLTIPTALIMVGVSILLSVLSGLIPSQSAAHKDPVVALRSGE